MKITEVNPTTITALLSGKALHLSNFDLLTLIVGEAAKSLMTQFSTLAVLDDATAQELSNVVGLEGADISRLLALRELSRRRSIEKSLRRTPIMSSASAVTILEPLLLNETREVVMALALDTKNRLTCPPITVAIGTIDYVPCHPREVFRPLIKVSASSCLISHFHPSSGEPVPSPDDIMMTKRLREAGELLGIPVMDHIVIGRGSFISMAERGLI